MADNLTLNSGSGGATLSTDEVTRSTVVQHVQYVKLMNGTDGAVDVIPGEATNGLDVDVTRSALPSGAATSANQTTIIGHLDGVEGLLTTIDADTSAVAGAVSGTEVQVDVVAALPAGTNNIGDVDVLTLPATVLAGGNLVHVDYDSGAGTQNMPMVGIALPASGGAVAGGTSTNPLIVVPQPHPAGGLSIFRSLDLDETEEEIKGTAGCVYGMWVTNTATSTRFVKFYNATAANVTVGTTTPVITIGIPGNSSDDVAGNFGPGGMGITFDTAITAAATTGVADADTGAPGANEVVLNVFYK